MASDSRHRSIAGLEELQVGDHLCFAYGDPDERTSVMVPYVAAGLASGDRVAVYHRAGQLGSVRAALETSVPDAAAAAERGDLVYGEARHAYLPDGTFEPERRLRAYTESVEAARAQGYRSFRVFADATEVVDDPQARARWHAYELRADLLSTRLPFTAVCAYDRTACDPQAMALLRAVHSTAGGRWDGDPPFSFHASDDGGLSLDGEVDFAIADALAAIAGDAAQDVSQPAIDLRGLRFIDVAGMRAVMAGARTMAGTHARVRIRGAGPTFKRLWTLLGCERLVEAEFEPA